MTLRSCIERLRELSQQDWTRLHEFEREKNEREFQKLLILIPDLLLGFRDLHTLKDILAREPNRLYEMRSDPCAI